MVIKLNEQKGFLCFCQTQTQDFTEEPLFCSDKKHLLKTGFFPTQLDVFKHPVEC